MCLVTVSWGDGYLATATGYQEQYSLMGGHDSSVCTVKKNLKNK